MPRTTEVKSILNKTKKRDAWFLDDYTVNPYSGCSFNCLFCYIRGSKYGTHMEQKLAVKNNAVALLDQQLALRAKRKQYGFIVLSSATDPYLQAEAETKLTQQLLEVILKHRFPVHIITRSHLVERDFELLENIHRNAILPADLEEKVTRKALLTFSFSTLSDTIAAIFEPGATPPSVRYNTLLAAKHYGLAPGVSLMPLLPWISDTTNSLQELFQAFAAVPAAYIFPASLTLFGNDRSDSKTLVFNAIRKHFPELLPKYESYFAAGSQMPAYYTNALFKKTTELCAAYNIPDRIAQL